MTGAMAAFSILVVLLIAFAASAYGVVYILTNAARHPARTVEAKTSGIPSNKDEYSAKRTWPLSYRDDELDELLKRRQRARESGFDTPLRAFLRDLLIRQTQDELMEVARKSTDSPEEQAS